MYVAEMHSPSTTVYLCRTSSPPRHSFCCAFTPLSSLQHTRTRARNLGCVYDVPCLLHQVCCCCRICSSCTWDSLSLQVHPLFEPSNLCSQWCTISPVKQSLENNQEQPRKLTAPFPFMVLMFLYDSAKWIPFGLMVSFLVEWCRFTALKFGYLSAEWYIPLQNFGNMPLSLDLFYLTYHHKQRDNSDLHLLQIH